MRNAIPSMPQKIDWEMLIERAVSDEYSPLTRRGDFFLESEHTEKPICVNSINIVRYYFAVDQFYNHDYLPEHYFMLRDQALLGSNFGHRTVIDGKPVTIEKYHAFIKEELFRFLLSLVRDEYGER